MTPTQARDITEILGRLANDLAAEIDAKAFENFPSHVEIAVCNEMARLRSLKDAVFPFTKVPYLEPIKP